LYLLLKVLTSLDEAYIAAGLKEGKAWAKYSFKGQSPKELSLRRVSATLVLSHSGNAINLIYSRFGNLPRTDLFHSLLSVFTYKVMLHDTFYFLL